MKSRHFDRLLLLMLLAFVFLHACSNPINIPASPVPNPTPTQTVSISLTNLASCSGAATAGLSYSVTYCVEACNTASVASTATTIFSNINSNSGNVTFMGWGYNGVYPVGSGTPPGVWAAGNEMYLPSLAAGACATIQGVYLNGNYLASACQLSLVQAQLPLTGATTLYSDPITIQMPCASQTPTPTVTTVFSMTYTPTVTYTATSALTPTFSPSPTPSQTETPTISNTPSDTLTSTPTYPDLIVNAPGPITFPSGIYYYSSVHVYPGYTLLLPMQRAVTMVVSGDFTLDATSTVMVDFYGGSETAGSPLNSSSAAGAGHAGAGGSDGFGNAGGPTYDSPFTGPGLPGSFGASGNCSYVAPGGGALILEIGGVATLNGLIEENGASSYGSPTCTSGLSGASSGGSIFIMANTITGLGSLEAQGGSGALDTSGVGNNSGGGGGGYIVLDSHTANTFAGTTSVTGGTAVAPAQPGQPGVVKQITY